MLRRGRHARSDRRGQLLCDGAHPLGDDLAVVVESDATWNSTKTIEPK
jgi:hypothetical protein